MSSTKQNILLVLASCVMAVIGAEVFLRLFMPQLTLSRLQDMVGSYYAASEFNTFTIAKNYKGTEPYIDLTGERVTITTNAHGFRGPELSPQKRKILIVGDSYTFGVYVEDKDTYAAQLQHLLDATHPNYQVINAGYVGGYETDQQYVWLNHEGLKLKPAVVILAVFLGNDILGIKQEAWGAKDVHGLPTRWIDKAMRVDDMGRLRQSGGDFHTVGNEPIYQYPVARNLHLAILASKAYGQFKLMTALPNATSDAPFAITSNSLDAGLGHIFGHYSPDFLAKEKIFHKLLVQMKRNVEASGARFEVALIPIDFMVQPKKMDILMPNSKYRHAQPVYYQRLSMFLRRNNIRYVDIGAAMNTVEHKDFFAKTGDVHFNPNGHRFAAETIYDFLNNENIIASAP